MGLNLILKLKHKIFNSSNPIYENLYKIGYFNSKVDPYKLLNVKYINPHYIFSLPLSIKKRSEISNETVEINKNGFRKTYLADDLNNDNFSKNCVIVLGGSTAFGWGVSSDKKTFASLIQAQLGSEYIVYNLGSPSWNSRQELTSVVNFISRPISKNCKSIKSISITGSNDIYITHDYLQNKNSILHDEINPEDLIAAPGAFSNLSKKVDNIMSRHGNVFKLSSDLISTLSWNLFGTLYTSVKGKLMRMGYIDGKSNYIDDDKLLYSDSYKDFVELQMNAFWKNHIFISNIIARANNPDKMNKHLVVIQPNLKNRETKTIWSFANNKIDETLSKQILPKNIEILDLRNFSLEDKNQHTSLYKELNSIPTQTKLSTKELLNLNFMDDVHLSDIGTKRASEIILENHFNNKTLY